MSSFQICYAIALLAMTYPATRAGHLRVVLVLWANMLAILAIAGAWDLRLIGADDRFAYYMVVDLASGAALVIKPGLSRVVSIGYAATFPFYALRINGLFTGDGPPLTVICAQAALQIGALAFGTFGDHSGGGKRRRFSPRRFSLAISRRGVQVFPGHVSQHSGEDLEVR